MLSAKLIDIQSVTKVWFIYGSNFPKFSELWKLNEKLQNSPQKCFEAVFERFFVIPNYGDVRGK